MTGARLDSVCRYICEKASWSVSNLRLQKLLYLAQMFYMGQYGGQRLVDTSFQAWDYGPVSPELYHQIKQFGASAIDKELRDIAFPEALNFRDTDPRKKILDMVCAKYLSYTPGQLVNITHHNDGAWAKYYQPGICDVVIPDAAIKGEYDARYSGEARQ